MTTERKYYGFKAAIVDDEPIALKSFTIELEELGFTVNSYLEPLKLITDLIEAQIDPDIILTDALMDQMWGRELAKQIRAIPYHVPILVITGIDTDHFHRSFGDLENIYLLQKPVLANELSEAVKNVLPIN